MCQRLQLSVMHINYLFAGLFSIFRFEETIHRFQNMIVDNMTGHFDRVPLGDDDIPFYISGHIASTTKSKKNLPIEEAGLA